ncbi:Nrd1 complex RNA-binding subunit, partial [Bonamia ostreae]
CSDIFIFYVKIKLTEKGKDNIEEVILLLYKYIDMLKKMTIKQWQKVYEEVKIVEENSFVYQSKQKPINYARDLSENIAIYDKTDILTGPHLLDQFDFNKIKAFLDLMEPENMLF